MLVVIFVGSLFVRDVIRSAHGAIGTRRAENRNFAALANVLITQENAFDQHLDYLLRTGSTLTRVNFDARLAQLDQQLPDWSTQASLLEKPPLAHHVQSTLAALTMTRVSDYQDILADVATSLQLPWPATAPVSVTQSVERAQASLVATTATWRVDRWALAREPGHVVLPVTSDQVGRFDVPGALANLAASPLLDVTRGIGVSAVLVVPSPLPAPTGEILLPPTGTIRLGITVTNASYVLQKVAVTYTFVQTNGARTSQTQTMAAVLDPLGSYAFVPKVVTTVSGARGELTIVAKGAPAGPGMSTTRHYLVIVSPSGNS